MNEQMVREFLTYLQALYGREGVRVHATTPVRFRVPTLDAPMRPAEMARTMSQMAPSMMGMGAPQMGMGMGMPQLPMGSPQMGMPMGMGMGSGQAFPSMDRVR